MARAVAGVMGLWLLVASAPALAGEQGPSLAVYPPQRIPLHFDHSRHLLTGVLECGDCHPAARSERASDRLLPGHSACVRCHPAAAPASGVAAPASGAAAPASGAAAPASTVEEADPLYADIESFYGPPPLDLPSSSPAASAAEDCGRCHPGWSEGRSPEPVALPEPNLRFGHRAHLEAGADCETCHGDMSAVVLATRAQLPRMERCLDCHDGARAARTCRTCHLEGADGRLVTAWPSGLLEPGHNPLGIEHGAGWRWTHRSAATARPGTCEACHSPSFCVDCHDGTLKPFGVHPADWVSAHPPAARQDAPSCSGCHRAQSDCVTCHERAGLGRDAPLGRVAGADPTDDPTFRAPLSNLAVHPEGWADFAPPAGADRFGAEHHSWHARRSIETCASCHREETCLSCHATGPRAGLGVDPHRAGFAEACRPLVRRNVRVCAKCHDESAEALCP